MKIVINKCYGGFSVSLKAVTWMAALGHALAQKELADEGQFVQRYGSGLSDIARNDPLLVEAVERLGTEANGPHSKLKVVDVEGDWHVDEYDGQERVVMHDPVYRGVKLDE